MTLPTFLLALDEHIRSIVRAELAALADVPQLAPLVRSDRCGVPNRKILEHVRAGSLPGVRIDGRVYVKRADLDRWIEGHRIGRPAGGGGAGDVEERIKAELTAALNAPPKPRRRRMAKR